MPTVMARSVRATASASSGGIDERGGGMMAEKKENETMTEMFAAFGKMFLLLGLMALQFVVNGFVITVLWDWYATPIFGLPSLTIPEAIGLGMIALLFSRSKLLLKEEVEKSQVERILFNFFEPLFLLLIGWIVTWFI